MWIVMIIVLSVIAGACLGFLLVGLATIAKGSPEDQRRSDQDEMKFLREWYKARAGEGR